MKIEDQVCSLDQAKKLKELGLSQESIFSWCGDENHIPEGSDKPWIWVGRTEPANNMELDYREDVPSAKPFAGAFTVAELGVMLENWTNKSPISTPAGNWEIIMNSKGDEFQMSGTYKTEAEARAAMLIHILESGKITAEQVNSRLTS